MKEIIVYGSGCKNCQNWTISQFRPEATQNLDLMPEQVKEWESDGETCSFKITGIGKIKMKFTKKENPSVIEMGPNGKAPLNFSLNINLKKDGDKTVAEGNINADLNPMLAMMAKRPLENLINEITTKLQGKF